MIKVYKILSRDECKGNWEDIAKYFKDYNIYQTLAYQKVRSSNKHIYPVRIEIYDDKDSIACAFIMREIYIPIIGIRIGYVQRGPLINHIKKGLVCTTQMFYELAEYLLSRGYDIVRMNCNTYSEMEGAKVKSMLENAGYTRNKKIVPYRTMILTLRSTADDLLNSLHRSWRKKIRRIQKFNVDVLQNYSTDSFRTLESLYKITREKKKFSGINFRTFLQTQSLLSEKEKLLITTVYVDNEPGTVLLSAKLGSTAVNIMAASSKIGYEYSTAYYAYWCEFINCQKDGLSEYDLGGIDPEKNPGVYKFKSGTGARDVSSIGIYEIYKNRLSRILILGTEITYRYLKKVKNKL